MKKMLLVLSVLLLVALSLCAQQWEFYGHGNSHAMAIQENILWIGHESNGISCLDMNSGEIIAEYNYLNSPLPRGFVTGVEIDSDGNKWFGLYDIFEEEGGGLTKFDGENWVVWDTENSLIPTNNILDIYIDDFGNIWTGSFGAGVIKFDGNNWNVYNSDNSDLVGENFLAPRKDSVNNLWVVSDTGLFKFVNSEWEMMDIGIDISDFGLKWKIEIDEDDNFWFPTESGLLKYDGTNWTNWNSDNSPLPCDGIASLAIDNQNRIWMGLEGEEDEGMAVFSEPNNWILYNENNSGLPTNSCIYSIVFDDEQTAWINTWDGIAEFNGTDWNVYQSSTSGLPGTKITDICISSSGYKWFSLHGALTQFDGNEWIIYDVDNSPIPAYHVDCSEIDNNGILWVGTEYGLAKMTPDGNWTEYDLYDYGLNDNEITCIAIDNYSTKWIGTHDGGLAKFDNTGWTAYKTSNSNIPDNMIECLAVDQENNLWVGTYWGGLAIFDGENWVVYNTTNSDIPGNHVVGIDFDNIGNIWLALYGEGIAKFDGTSWVNYNSQNSDLPIDDVSCIMCENGNVWVGTGDPEDEDFMAEGSGLVKINGTNWEIFNISNSGLDSNKITCLANEDDGKIWIGTRGGVSVYDPNYNSIEDLTIPFPNTISISNYPNPFNPSTTISYNIPQSGQTELKIYNIRGQLVKQLVNEYQECGEHTISWNGKDDSNSPVSSGIYFSKVFSAGNTQVHKMMMIK